MRLIDADIILNDFCCWYCNQEACEAEMHGTIQKCATLRALRDVINDTPTAYDVDKVVEELEKEKDIHAMHFNLSIYKDVPEVKQRYEQALGIIDKSIEIVKKGINNETN